MLATGWQQPRRFLSSASGGKGEEAGEQASAEVEAAAVEEAEAGAEAEETVPEGPQVLWQARALTKEFETTQYALGTSAVASAVGMGFGLLGVAPFSPPNPFMIGLLLAVVQVNLAHTVLTRQVRAQVRRHLMEIVQTSQPNSEVEVTLKYDGGLHRTLRLTSGAAGDGKPSLKDVIRLGNSFTVLDRKLGTSELPDALERLLECEQGIASEDLTVTPIGEESQEEADKVVQRFTALSRDHLKKLDGKDTSTAAAQLASIGRTSQITAGVILTGGLILCLGARSKTPAVAAAA